MTPAGCSTTPGPWNGCRARHRTTKATALASFSNPDGNGWVIQEIITTFRAGDRRGP
jgi:hypothetical protein